MLQSRIGSSTNLYTTAGCLLLGNLHLWPCTNKLSDLGNLLQIYKDLINPDTDYTDNAKTDLYEMYQ